MSSARPLATLRGQLSAHLYTSTSWRGCPPLPEREELYEELIDPTRGSVPLRGHVYYASAPRADIDSSSEITRSAKLLVVVHGLSSQPDSRYLSPFIYQGLSEGYDVISLALRGSIGEGCDHYHAGFTDDLRGLLSSAPCQSYRDVRVIGCSLGGQVALRYAVEGADPRVSAVVAVCPPIDLTVTQRRLDSASCRVYRAQLLRELKRAYRLIWENARRADNPLPTELDYVSRSRSIYDWDERVVITRFGFDSVKSYQRAMSLDAEQLSEASAPCFLLFTRHDPIINTAELLPRLTPRGALHVKVLERGGHLGFPLRVDLDLGSPPAPLAAQLSEWVKITINA